MMNFRETMKRNKILVVLHRYIFSFPKLNVNRTRHKKTALLSYSIFPFINKSRSKIHPNFIEVHELNRVLNLKKYNVDVYNNTYDRKINYNKYDLIIGEGLPISRFFKSNCTKNIKTIYYATGSHPSFQNQASFNTLVQFYQKSHNWLEKSSRIVDQEWAIGASLSDYCIIIGNNETKKTYMPFHENERLFTIYPPYYNSFDNINVELKDKNSYLWFGSYGLIHKGLDIVIEAFLLRKDLTLYICGYLEREKEVLEFYKQRINQSKNIVIVGFISIDSRKFCELMQICSFTVLTSVAEGMSTAVITVMGNGGLIPIVTRETGIDVNMGICVESNSVNSLLTALEISSDYSLSDIQKKCTCIQREIIDKSNSSEFSQRITEIADEIL